MSSVSEFLSVVRKIFLLSEELTRLSAEVKDLTHTVHDHEGRLIRLETMVEMAGKRSRLILPGE